MKNGILSPEEAAKTLLGDTQRSTASKPKTWGRAAGKPAASPVFPGVSTGWKSGTTAFIPQKSGGQAAGITTAPRSGLFSPQKALLEDTQRPETQKRGMWWEEKTGSITSPTSFMEKWGGSTGIKAANTQFGRGNIDLTTRPKVPNPDGSISTVRSMSFEEDGKEILVPTVILKDGKWQIVSNAEAIQHYHDSGEYLGKFDTVDAANSYAQELHEAQDRLYMGTGSQRKYEEKEDRRRGVPEYDIKALSNTLGKIADRRDDTNEKLSAAREKARFAIAGSGNQMDARRDEQDLTSYLDELDGVEKSVLENYAKSVSAEQNRAMLVYLGELGRPLTASEKIVEKAVTDRYLTDYVESYGARPETYTPDNIDQNMGRIKALSTMGIWTDEQRKEAEEILRVMDGYGGLWQNFMFGLTGDSEKYQGNYNQITTRKRADSGDYSGAGEFSEIYGDLSNKVHVNSSAAVAGLIEGTGALSLAEAITKGLSRAFGNEKAEAAFDKQIGKIKDISQYGQVNAPLAHGAGSIAGTLALWGDMSKLVGAVPGMSMLPKAAGNILTSAGAFAGSTAVQNAGDLASGRITPEQYWDDVGKSGVAGGVGGAASEVVGAVGGSVLKHMGLKNSLPANILRDGVSGIAFAGGNMGANMALDPKYRPTGEEAVKDLTAAFLFSSLGSVLKTLGRSQTDKVRLQQLTEDMKRDYATIVNNAEGQATLDALDDMAAKSAQVRAELANKTFLGQQKTVDALLDSLSYIDDQVAGARATIYNSGVSAGAASGGASGALALPNTGGASAMGTGSSPAALSGGVYLPTAAELNPGMLGGMAAQTAIGAGTANSQTFENLPTATVDSRPVGPYHEIKEFGKGGAISGTAGEELEGQALEGTDDRGKGVPLLRYGAQGIDAGGIGAAPAGAGSLGGEPEGAARAAGGSGTPDRLKPYGREGEVLGGDDTRGAGGEVLWHSLQGAQPGGQGLPEDTNGFLGRTAAEGKTVGQDGTVVYAYRVTPPETYRPETGWALEEYRAFGIEPVVVDSFERNLNGRTILSTDALTDSSGKVYLLNGSTVDGKNSAAHEALHVGLRKNLPATARFYDMAQDVDISDQATSKYLQLIEKAYFEETGKLFDPKRDMEYLQEEFTAFLSGAINDGTALAEFGSAISDFDSLEDAWRQMKQELGGGIAKPGFMPRAGERLQAGDDILPMAGEGIPKGPKFLPTANGTDVNRQPSPGGFSEIQQLDGGGLEDGRWYSIMGEDPLPEPESAKDGYWDALLSDRRRTGEKDMQKLELENAGENWAAPHNAEEELEGGHWDSIMGEDLLPEPESMKDGYWNALLSDLEGRETATGTQKDHVDGVREAFDDWMSAATGESEGAQVRTEVPGKPKGTIRETLKEEKHNLYRKIVDSGEAVGRMGMDLKDPTLYAYYNFARASSNAAGNMLQKGGAQTDVWGHEVGKSLADLFKPIRARGDGYYSDFETYLFHRHNIDRMSRDNRVAIAQAKDALDVFDEGAPEIARLPESDLMELAGQGDEAARMRLELLNAYNRAKNIVNKPVFGQDVTAMDSADAVSKFERKYPEFAEQAEKVYQYNRNLMQYRVDSGLLTQEQADHIQKTYPNYVPTYRLTEGELAREQRRGQRVSRTVGRATGGNADLMPLHVAMARQTMQVVRNGSVNRFGSRMLEDYQKDRGAGGKYIYEVSDAKYEAHPDFFDLMDDPTPKKENTFTVYQDGKAVQMTVDKGIYEGVSVLTPGKNGIMNANFWKPVEAASRLFKSLVTGYNPMFSARNFARDLQEAGLYSKDLGAWTKNYPLAVQEIATNGLWWQRYQALGGVYSSVFDYQQGYKQGDREHGKVRRYSLDKVEAVNMAIEQAPRLAEFMAQAKKNGDTPKSLMDAMLAAADVTTNFGRSGGIGKFLNRTFVPFLNPAIQGLDKMGRTFLGKKSGKDWLKLIARCALLGIAPMVINAILNKDEPGWEDVRDSDKDVNWLISLGDGRYIKIPKGRDISVVGMLADRASDLIRGEDVDWGGVVTIAANQIAPPNPLENNIIAAWADADLLDPSSPGKTWYGSDIESQRLQGYEPGERYDERTDVFSKWLGGVLGLSPKKINYILDQYSGVVGDFVLPLLTPQAEQNPFEKAFVLDSVSSNKINGEFYDTSDSITYAKNGGDAPMSVVNRFWSRQSKAVSDIYSQIREIENSTEFSDAEKRDQVREAKGILNGIQKNAMEVLPAYEEAVRKHYTGDSDKEMDETYLQANREVFGAEYALQAYNTQVYERAVSADRQGVGFEDYFDVYFDMKDLETTNEKRDVLAKTSLTDQQKIVLYRDRITKERDDDILASVVAGLPFNDFMEAQNAYTDIDKRKGMSASEKRTEFVHWMDGQLFTATQRDMLLEAFRFATWAPAQETTYEKLMGWGLDSTQAYAAAGGIRELEPLDGKSQVSTIQRGRVIVDGDGSDEQKAAALAAVLSETEYAKMETAYQHGVSPRVYISYRETLLDVDDGNGSITQAETRAAIDRLELSNEQKAALWQLQNTSWKYWKNPYSGAVGRAVLEAYNSRPTGEGPVIQLRYGSNNTSSRTGDGQIKLRFGSGGTNGGTDDGQIKLRFGPDGTNTKTGDGQIKNRYGGTETETQAPQEKTGAFQGFDLLPTARDLW